jgi:hypothetical protein
MPRPPRTPKTGDIPIASETQRISRVRTIRLLLGEGLWRNEASKIAYCRDWKCSPATMDDYVREARRSLRYDVADHPEEIVHQLACTLTARTADMIQRIDDQVEQDAETKQTVSVIGRKGKMSWQAYAQINQTVLSALSQMTSLVTNHGAVFVPKDKQGDAAATTLARPPVTVVVKYADVPEDPKPPEPAPPADAAPMPTK